MPHKFIVKDGELERMVIADTPAEAYNIVREVYEEEWGAGAFEQYEPEVHYVPDED